MGGRISKTRICTVLIVIIGILQMLVSFHIADCGNLMALCGVIVLCLAFNMVGSVLKKMVIAFVLIGISLNVYTGQPVEVWTSGINYMLNVIAILVVMQLFTIPIGLGDYKKHLQYIILRFCRSERKTYLFSLLTIHAFSSFLLFGTIPVMLSLLGEPLKNVVSKYKYFMSTALLRGYALVVMWAPGAVNILLAMNATGAQWSDIFAQGILISGSGLVIGYFMASRQFSSADIKMPEMQLSDRENKEEAKIAIKKCAGIIFLVVILVLLIMFFGWLKIGNNTSRVMLAGLILSMIWLGSFYKHPLLKSKLQEYADVSLLKTIDLSVLYIALGFFSKALQASGVLESCFSMLTSLVDVAGIFMIPILAVLVLCLSLLGLHPFILMVLLGQIMTGLHTGFSPATISLSLILGAGVSYMVSPLAGMVLTTSRFLDIPNYVVGTKWNWKFCTVLFIVGNIIIISGHLLGS